MADKNTAPETTASTLRVKLRGEDLGEFDPMKLSLSDGFLIENESGLTTKQFVDGIGELRAIALQTLVWLLMRRQGKTVERRLIDFTLDQLDMDGAGNPTEETSGGDASDTSVS